MSEESSTYFRTNNILTIDIDNCNCTFEYLGSVSTSKGAALYIDDSNLTISEVTFTHNKAVYGAAIELDCLTSLKCSYTIANCTFENNTATSRGGAIRYNLYRPTFENNTYIGNSAAYGPNIASYAIKVIQQNSTSDSVILDNVGSGIQYDGSMVLQLVDHDNQVMILDSSSQISIQAKSSNQSVTGTTTKKIVKGIATFDELIFESYPGDTNIEFKITSSALKQNVLELQYGVNFSQAPITVNFRYCQPGEIIQGNLFIWTHHLQGFIANPLL